MPFTYPITIKFGEVDAAGIVYFARVFDYFHRAFESLLESLDAPMASLLQQEAWIMPIVHAEADYRKPMRLGDKLRVQVTVESLGKHSLTLLYKVEGCEGSDLRVEGKHVHVFIAKSGMRPIPIPSAIHAKFSPLCLDLSP